MMMIHGTRMSSQPRTCESQKHHQSLSMMFCMTGSSPLSTLSVLLFLTLSMMATSTSLLLSPNSATAPSAMHVAESVNMQISSSTSTMPANSATVIMTSEPDPKYSTNRHQLKCSMYVRTSCRSVPWGSLNAELSASLSSPSSLRLGSNI